ncbi:MAG: hypothetical protein A2287_03805 [Candidatus Melainabacteria bacterium RIFOXYA12_FULL_32_12]|nr:MAG: hypothetical protein A2255_04740 [Candidatus Melainabacteria bacterium RIFOXYA2_FULL_32_9]OGI25709.1 MAG: hypothetical protein A2287_03805 [Candidatus Melainabacteria bacterium RIFOXYA12_FULL_32_12]
MAKAINWPEEFYDEVINEDLDRPKIALRLGTLYYDNGYYVNGEAVDIRVNHKIVRRAKIIDEMRIAKIKELSDDILSMYKSTLREKSKVISFLASSYNKTVDEEAVVTIVIYQNIPLESNEEIDDPHVD